MCLVCFLVHLCFEKRHNKSDPSIEVNIGYNFSLAIKFVLQLWCMILLWNQWLLFWGPNELWWAEKKFINFMKFKYNFLFTVFFSLHSSEVTGQQTFWTTYISLQTNIHKKCFFSVPINPFTATDIYILPCFLVIHKFCIYTNFAPVAYK